MAYLEPQETIWKGQSGRSFKLEKLRGTNNLKPFEGIAGFNSQSSSYNKTLFRFPLRIAPSKLSENNYNIQKVNQLINALRSEAKLLLLFLRSIHTIEVYNIDQHGNHKLSFRSKIADAFVPVVVQKRTALLKELKSYSGPQQYNIARPIKFTVKFDICVYDANTGQTTTSQWLVANQVGSTNATVRGASIKQKVFPWVGTAVELDKPGNGRIFCFLPMPVETASNLPVHINGTFGLTDDRRSLKWPGVERKNDLTADWNKLLVHEVIPSCYADLLLESKSYFNSTNYYNAWPRVHSLRSTQWEPLLKPVFSAILSKSVIWSASGHQKGEWVTPSTAIFVPSSPKLISVVERVLTTCGVKLADVPSHVRDAFAHVRIPMTDASPKLARDKLRSMSHSYSSIDPIGKCEILKYCLNDGAYTDLSGLQLLPLCNGQFATYENPNPYYPTSYVYLCTRECPRSLLPNLDQKLVDTPKDPPLQNVLTQVARYGSTQLKELTLSDMPALIDEAMPSQWKHLNIVSYPNSSNFPESWFKEFWNWVKNKQLRSFKDSFILPVLADGNGHFNVVKLTAKPILYGASCDKKELKVLRKFRLFCCVKSMKGFTFVAHKELKNFTHSIDSNGICKALSISSGHSDVILTYEEAACLRQLVSSADCYTYSQVLRSLRMFKSDFNSDNRIYSVDNVCRESLIRGAVVLDTSGGLFRTSVIPSNIIVFTSDEYSQQQLLRKLGFSFLKEAAFLKQYIFPYITNRQIADRDIDKIMVEVLTNLSGLAYQDGSISDSLRNLPFVKTSFGARECPGNLYDPQIPDVSEIFYSKSVFPCEPYNKFIPSLRTCGMRSSISQQEIIDTILSIALPYQEAPRQVDGKKFACATAILKYIIGSANLPNVYCSLPRDITYGSLTFSGALDTVSRNRCWLPVLSNRPSGYPSQLPWKGEGLGCHVCSLNSSVSVSTTSNSSLPLVYGTQVYFTQPELKPGILTSNESPVHLVAHLQVMIDCSKHFTQKEMFDIVHKIYSAMLKVVNSGSLTDLLSLKSIEKWIYIKEHNKFVSPSAVAMEQNVSFRHNLEPYLHKLPDSISDYSSLFTSYGMSQVLSEDQIVSVLSAMREDISGGRMSISVDTCWDIVMAILNWLTGNGTKECSRGYDGVYVPVESESEWPDLEPASEVIYTDNEFFKNFTTSSETDKPLHFIHKRVSLKIAECLQLTPLSEELDIAADTFEDTGQYEPLTTRLKNILRDYKDGLTIIKELIQNADDAEATEINICFDARTHCRDTSKLFFPGMCESHGPALVVQNNTVFSNEDFENITKLAGATKKNKHLKIGKFGIGFCSVYHITDVPSFLSRDRLYIFDPTLNHLGKEIKNPALPGKRLKFTTKIIQKSKQLDPYHGLFNFNRSESYNGTMFRLPFRTSPSELSGKCYSETTALELLDDIYNSSESLITFLQHVHTITYQRINNGETQPTTLFTVHREEVPLPHTLVHECTTALSVASKKNLEAKSSTWLVSQHSTSNGEKDAVASIACKLTESSPGVYGVDKSLTGEVFCYLPLSLSTGLPVHVSCNFAVINNRRGIWTAEESSASADETEVSWNIFLMENAIPEAYLRLLLTLKDMQKTNMLDNYTFHDLWPLSSELSLRNPWSRFVSNLYGELSYRELFFSESRQEWKSMSDSRFLAPNILSKSETDQYVLEILIHLKLPLVNLPVKYRDQFDLSGVLIDEVGFINLFFSNLTIFENTSGSRNAVLRLMLEALATGHHSNTTTSTTLQGCMKGVACIPCSPDGMRMKKCDELVHPEAAFAKLYDASEGMFPFNELLKGDLVELALTHLGIIKKSIPWSYVTERAQTVKPLMNLDSHKAYTRMKNIIEAMTSHTDGSPPPTFPSIDTVEFLPVMKRPDDFCLTWRGDGVTLSCGKEMMLSGGDRHSSPNVTIAGSQCMFLCEADPQHKGCGRIIDRAVRSILGLKTTPSVSEVLAHFTLIINNSKDLPPEWVTNSCRQIYDYLNKEVAEKRFTESDAEAGSLKSLPCVWVEQTHNMFITVGQVSFDWSKKGPYLFAVPAHLASKRELCEVMDIKRTFSIEEVNTALQKMKSDFDIRPIDEPCQRIIGQLSPLFEVADSDFFKGGSFLLPDENYILRCAKDLAYNDAPWAPKDDSHVYVNDVITRRLAEKLGVRFVRSRFLDKYQSVHGFKGGVPFGQREELTRRIQNILCDYPLDITLLKELLQNADDAKATKLHVIMDKRFHNATSVLSEEWQDLQGPAMLVWNDSVFSEKDLEGIQNLGLGSKRTEAESIGQYGIGFNVVYHITDCPSFVTNDETLCIMDPHCRYAPGADPLSPGRRFDKLNEGFWKDFPDMKSAFLRSGVDDIPTELMTGSLFRFPIRHKERKYNESKIVDNVENLQSTLTADELGKNLHTWMSRMKEAMLFLNNVAELKLFTIENGSTKLTLEFHFRTAMDEAALSDRTKLQGVLSSFKSERGCESCVIMYPLTLTEVDTSDKSIEEKWLIQQGVGDIYDSIRTWNYIKTVKPRHGIAAPLSVRAASEDPFKGQVFCFLPLPVKCDFPVHVNGHFILNSTRRELWKCTDVGGGDNRSTWNDNLAQALSSSYANFLVNAKTLYVSAEYKTLRTAVHEIQHYYSLFPVFGSEDTTWNKLACDVYKLITKYNHPVLCVVEASGDGGKFTTKWYPPIASIPPNHVYYCNHYHFTSGSYKDVIPILQRIGMKISPAPSDVMTCFNKLLKESNHRVFSAVSEKSVFEYYTEYSTFSSQTFGPTKIKDTAFESTESYLTFTRYIVSEEPQEIGHYVGHAIARTKEKRPQKYPSSPIGHFLLLTADETLRKFDKEHLVLMSTFSSLFPNSLDSFLHPDMLCVHYIKSYFIQVKDDSPTVVNTLLHAIEQNFPREMKSVNVTDADTTISKDKLCSLWTCFTDDKVFNKHIPTILKQWALLRSQDNRLFSLSSKIIPVIFSYNFKSVCGVMKKIKIPFLDVTVVVTQSNCPSLREGPSILSNFYHTNIETPLLTLLEKADLEIIINYLKLNEILECDPELKTTVVQQVQSLPLFENIDGSYTSILNKSAYIWPGGASSVAYQKWLEGYDTVFIKSGAKWSSIGSAEQLSVSRITAEELYVKFIFPHFHKMDDDDRFQHLLHIRDYNMYQRNTADADITVYIQTSDDIRVRKYRAQRFISALNSLCCISDGSSLQPVSHFCDHTVTIFNTFSCHFSFLPDMYKDSRNPEEWLTFFRQLGMKQTVSNDEFLCFCKETANDAVDDIKECSKVLLEYLYSQRQVWDVNFLDQVSRIAFVLQVDLPKLNWVVPQFYPVRVSQLVCLRGSAHLSNADLLWTVKSIVRLPSLGMHMVGTSFQEKLGITVNPTVSDVIANVQNICTKSRYAEQGLFSNYPDQLQCPVGKSSLLDIMYKNLSYLDTRSGSDVSKLKSLPCLPVYNTTSREAACERSLVLVKPCQVVNAKYGSYDVKKFHPFLHCLPEKLNLPHSILEAIDVKRSLELCHVKIVLQSIFEASGGAELDMNTDKCVTFAIEKLEKFLETLRKETSDAEFSESATEVLSPLYLPDSENKMRPSKSLLFGDKSNYWGEIIDLDLSDIDYFHFNITAAKYRCSATDLCHLLPDSVRPVGLSTVCKQVVMDSCPKAVESEVALQFMQTIEIPDIPEAIVGVINKTVSKQGDEDDLKVLVRTYLSKIEVVTINGLKFEIIHEASNKCIGSLGGTKFCFVPGEDKHILYLDTNYDPEDDDAHSEIAEHLCNTVCQSLNVESVTRRTILHLIKTCLKAKSAFKVHQELSRLGISINQTMHSFVKRLGEEIPECWHHRLEQDIDNVYNPMEYVGYEDTEGHIIIAQIVHPIESEPGTQKLEKQYKIYVKEDDAEGINVNILSLFKFLVGRKRAKVESENDEQTLVPFREDDEVASLRSRLIQEDLIEIMKKICQQLREIWKLEPDLRRKAIKRLFLQWHPDKNSDDPAKAEEIFKFLLKQIEHLEKGEPLDDPATKERGTTSHYSRPWRSGHRRHYYYHHSSYNFRSWGNTANQHHSSSTFEDSFFSGGGGGGGGRGGGGGYGGGSGRRTASSDQTSADYFPFDKEEDEKDPDEGRRWVKQAEAEFKVLKLVHSQLSVCSGYSYVCFMAHQVVEKALKGGVYALCGLDGRNLTDNKLIGHAYALKAVKPDIADSLPDHCIPLEDHYLKTRYPNHWPNYRDTPSDHYSEKDADQAKKHAEAVLEIVKSIMPAADDEESDPGESDPGESDPGESDPGESDPGESDPGESDPGESDPGESDPGESDPGQSDPGESDPGPGESDPDLEEEIDPDPEEFDPNPEESDPHSEESDLDAEESDPDPEEPDREPDPDPEEPDPDLEEPDPDPEEPDPDPEEFDPDPEEPDPDTDESDPNPGESDT